jgi:hypothetical protein
LLDFGRLPLEIRRVTRIFDKLFEQLWIGIDPI